MLYRDVPARVIAAKIGRTPAEVKQRARILGLKSLSRQQKRHPLCYYSGKKKYRRMANGCWQWIAGRNKKGYPLAKGFHTTLVYREIYIRKFGPIPKGKTLDHTCKNRACVNIQHLELVPHIVNVRRSKRTILSTEKVSFIRSQPAMRTGDLAKLLGATYSAVYFARRGDSWKTL